MAKKPNTQASPRSGAKKQRPVSIDRDFQRLRGERGRFVERKTLASKPTLRIE